MKETENRGDMTTYSLLECERSDHKYIICTQPLNSEK